MTFIGNITSQNSGLFTPNSASTIPLAVQGAASQTGNLQEWRNSAGTVQARVTSSGSIVTTQGFAVLGGASISGSTAALFQSSSAGRIPVTVQGAASQTANLQEWQNSAGTVLARVDLGGFMFGQAVATLNSLATITEESSGGRLRLTKATSVMTAPGANLAKIYLRDGTNAGTLKLVVRAGAAGAETTILDNIPQ
jgi:hypothetical protein